MTHQPEIVLLYCQHSVRRDADITAASARSNGFAVRAVLMPCSSKVQVSDVLKVLETGVDGVEVVACPDKACRFLVGSCRAEKRIRYACALLDQAGMGAARLGLSRAVGLTADELIDLAAARAQAVGPLGSNPMKAGDAR